MQERRNSIANALIHRYWIGSSPVQTAKWEPGFYFNWFRVFTAWYLKYKMVYAYVVTREAITHLSLDKMAAIVAGNNFKCLFLMNMIA